jgi:hypothetical protein
VLANLEAQEYDLTGRPTIARPRGDESSAPAEASAGPAQLQLFAAGEEAVARALRAADLDRLTPLEALNLLHELRKRLDS